MNLFKPLEKNEQNPKKKGWEEAYRIIRGGIYAYINSSDPTNSPIIILFSKR